MSKESRSDLQIPRASIHRIEADGVKIFYREAGPIDAPVVLLLHGFPTSSFQYRELIPRLADRYRVIAPDLPGFGFTEVPSERHYNYTFDALAESISAFTDALALERYALYVFDYGAPTGFRLAMARPERITAIVSQNGNAYEEGLGDAWAPIRRYWSEPTATNREAIRKVLNLEGMRREYASGIPNPEVIAPEGIHPRCRPARTPWECRHPTGSLPRLCQQRKALSRLPGIFQEMEAALVSSLGQVRSVFHPRRRRGLPA
jgi:pimeloyl-ACP methyl ester carboxylesterase